MARKKAPRGLGPLIFIVAVALIGLVYTEVSGNRPLLGLDLQGGVSVVLQPKDSNASSDSLNQAKKIIDQRINGLGVAESEVTVNGKTVLVQIPGVKDQQRALDLVGQTAELQFRPVLASFAPPSGDTSSSDTSTGDTSTGGTAATGATDSTAAGGSTTTAAPTDSSQQGLGAQVGQVTPPAPAGAAGESALGALAGQTDSTPAPAATDPGTSTGDSTASSVPTSGATTSPTVTPADQITPDATVILPQVDPKTGQTTALYQLGPVGVTGSSLEGAVADLNQQGQWEVRPTFKSGADGIDKFNSVAGQCFTKAQSCPTGQLAVVLDNKVLTAPSINAASFTRDQITISGSFDEKSAKDIALALRYGALPVELVPQQSQIVSATLGRDALHAGLVAGLVGFVLVGLYMIAFYRLLGVLAMVKLFIEGAILWSLLCYLGATQGLALTLAGITGIIVSIGVSLDSNVVYYEHLKEDVRAGRSIRSAVDKSFASAWSTILAADGASIIGAALLYFLTIGAVRGFALYLGISTVLDLITSYCYMRPVVRWATTSDRCAAHPHQFGLPAGPSEPATTGRGGRPKTPVAAGGPSKAST